MTLQDEIRDRIQRDAMLGILRAKIQSGEATFEDTFAYNSRAAELLGKLFSERLPDVPLEEREALCVALLRDRYTDVNELIDRVLRAQDEAQGLHLAPQRAPFNDERSHQIGSSLRDMTVSQETQQRRARSAPETMTRSMHDDRMKKEADFRSRAGLKCYITRKTDGNCCPWCSAMAGRYVYGEEPDDVFRRHDNCGCSVTYENGRQRQDVWSKRTWEAPEADAGADEPVRFTDETRPQGAGELTRFTKENAPKGAGGLTKLDLNAIMFTRAKYPNRRVRDDGEQIIDKATYQRLTHDFVRRGGIIRSDEEAVRILEGLHVHATYMPSFGTIAFSPTPTVSEVLEETYHAEQDRTNMFGVYGSENTDEIILRREIDAQHYLLSLTEKYKIPDSEVALTKFNLANYERDLEKLLQESGGE